jgi:hypothetical protein
MSDTLPPISAHATQDSDYGDDRSLLLNGFAIEFSATLEVLVRPMPDPADVKDERARLADYWFVHWVAGELFCLRLKAGGPNVQGVARTIKSREFPWLLRARLDDIVPAVFGKYSALRTRPFTTLFQHREVIAEASDLARVRHPLLAGFKILPKFALHPKIVEQRDGETVIGIFITIGMRYKIDAEIALLQKAGIDLAGLYAVHRNHLPGQRRLAGRIERYEDGNIHLSEASDKTVIPASDLCLEGSLESFAHCLKALLGTRYTTLHKSIDEVEATFRTGPKFEAFITQMGVFLQKKSPMSFAAGLQAHVGPRIEIKNTLDATSFYTVPPVEYVFDRAGTKRDQLAWQGLQRNGPYDRTTFAKKSPRILVLYPDTIEGKVDTFLKALRDGVQPGRAFPNGFAKTFGLVNPDFQRCPVRLFGGGSPSVEAAYRRAAEDFLAKDSSIDACIVAIMDEHAHLPTLQNPYVRTKAFFLTLGIPSQDIKLSTITQRPESLQYTLQNFSIALYAKLNGTPWTVDQDTAITDEIVVGMGVAELSGSRNTSRQRFVGITTVFGGDGNYLLGNISHECNFANYPDTLRASMSNVIEDVKKRNNWQPGDTVRVIFHAHKPLKRDEVADIVFECAKKAGSGQNLQMAFVTVTHDHPFFLIDPNEKGVLVSQAGTAMKGVLAPKRGTIVRIGRWTRALAVNSHRLIKRANSPLPKPLLINLHPDSTFFDLDYLAEQVLKFTALSWRSTLPAGTPVTIYYSERIAELLARLRQVPDWSATALSVKLRWSRWFL